MKKKMLAVLLSGFMAAAALSGCGSQDDSSDAQNSTAEESRTGDLTEESTQESAEEVRDYSGKVLRIGWWGSDTRNEQTMTIIEEFEKLYPGLTVEVEYSAFGDYFTKLNTQAAGGELPDVMQMDVSKIYMYASNDQLLDLSPFIENGSIDLSNVSEDLISLGEVCGGNYAIACGFNGGATIYNPDIVEEAGCTLNMKLTLSEYLDTAKIIYEKTGAKIQKIPYEALFVSMGGDQYANGEDALGFTEEMLLTYMTAWMEAVEAGYVYTPDNAVATDLGSGLATDELWCISQSSNQIVSYENASGKTLEMVEETTADDPVVENAIQLRPSMYWSVAADTELSELAAAFIDYFTNNTSVYDVCGAERGVPISSVIREYLSPSLSEAEKKTFDYAEYMVEHSSTPKNLYTPAKADEAWALITELTEKIQYKAVTWEELPDAVHEVYEKAGGIIGSAE